MSQRTVINIFEEVAIILPKGEKHLVKTKVDTGAFRTSIDRQLAEKLGLLDPENVIGEVVVKSSLGKHKRPVIELSFMLKGQKVETSASLSDRSKLNYEMIIGRRDLEKFAIEYQPQNEIESSSVG